MSEQKEKLIFESLQNDLISVGPYLKEIAQNVIKDEISQYPVFVAAQEHVEIGKMIFNPEQHGLNWFFTASLLEEFVSKKLIDPSNLNRFKRTFGDPTEKACIFAIFEQEGRFVFVPYDIS